MHVLIAGGSGFLGKALTRFFITRNNEVTIIGRSKTPLAPNKIIWADEEEIMKALNKADVLINLAGKSVDCRYTDSNKRQILSSRVEATRNLNRFIKQVHNPPKLWINSSTATIYRHAIDRPMTEKHGEIGDDFSMNVAKEWERSFFENETNNTRKVAIRTSIVLGNEGGAFLPLKRLTQLGLGGKAGNGKQMVSWIHIDDFCRAVQWIIEHRELEGTINVTAQMPITNKIFMETLRKSMGMKFGIANPKWLVKFGAMIIGTEPELILKSRWVLPEILSTSGFKFNYPDINSALKELA